MESESRVMEDALVFFCRRDHCHNLGYCMMVGNVAGKLQEMEGGYPLTRTSLLEPSSIILFKFLSFTFKVMDSGCPFSIVNSVSSSQSSFDPLLCSDCTRDLSCLGPVMCLTNLRISPLIKPFFHCSQCRAFHPPCFVHHQSRWRLEPQELAN